LGRGAPDQHPSAFGVQILVEQAGRLGAANVGAEEQGQGGGGAGDGPGILGQALVEGAHLAADEMAAAGNAGAGDGVQLHRPQVVVGAHPVRAPGLLQHAAQAGQVGAGCARPLADGQATASDRPLPRSDDSSILRSQTEVGSSDSLPCSSDRPHTDVPKDSLPDWSGPVPVAVPKSRDLRQASESGRRRPRPTETTSSSEGVLPPAGHALGGSPWRGC